MWYLIQAHNSDCFYGWTENPAVVDAAVDWANRDREINLFWAVEVDEAEGLSNLSSLLFHGESEPDDFRH
ncbi:hypothetical protein [Agrobacterium tumefaciens]|uniref:hypothetical protein n=1 Tax=Agrobacterium tumefaciens TaxID=358 RepID=UPI001573A667|nr:hypothetical protein [Agrobacterium tumefaciens]